VRRLGGDDHSRRERAVAVHHALQPCRVPVVTIPCSPEACNWLPGGHDETLLKLAGRLPGSGMTDRSAALVRGA